MLCSKEGWICCTVLFGDSFIAAGESWPGRACFSTHSQLHLVPRWASEAGWRACNRARRVWRVRSVQRRAREHLQELPLGQVGTPQVRRQLPLPESQWRDQPPHPGETGHGNNNHDNAKKLIDNFEQLVPLTYFKTILFFFVYKIIVLSKYALILQFPYFCLLINLLLKK